MEICVQGHEGDSFCMDSDSLVETINKAAFVRFYDAAHVEANNVMAPLDWAVSTLLQAPIRRYSPLENLASSSSEMWHDCNQALVRLGPDIPLENDEALEKDGDVENCFRAFMEPKYIGPSIAAKTLHKKRPQLIPVVDDYVAMFLTGRRGSTLWSKTITEIIFGEFRDQLRENQAALSEVCIGTEGLGLSACRVLDITIWMHVDKNRAKYGIR